MEVLIGWYEGVCVCLKRLLDRDLNCIRSGALDEKEASGSTVH